MCIKSIGCAESKFDERELLAKSGRLELEDLKEVMSESMHNLMRNRRLWRNQYLTLWMFTLIYIYIYKENIAHFEA